MFDLLVTNIKVADGVTSSLQDVDIAVTNGMIAAIAPGIDPGRARQVIDGGGKVAAPGFIDVHSHSDYYLIIDNRAHGKLLQGVTTEIGGNCGYAAAPMEGEVYDIRSKDYHTQFGIDVAWRGLDEYFKALAAAKPAVNYVALIGYNTVRGSVMGFVDRAPTTDEMKQIRSMIGKALDDGAAGMSVGVVYPPACFSSEAELIEASREVAVRGKVPGCSKR
jgi:N-acyl-D-amino-acid deacylase